MSPGVQGFLEGLTRLGLAPRVEGDLILYGIEPVDGARAGLLVETAVSVEELSRWPLVPPHWLHFPGDVRLARTNSQPSSRSAWTKHSRQIKEWGHEPNPAAGWAGHVRGVLSEADS